MGPARFPVCCREAALLRGWSCLMGCIDRADDRTVWLGAMLGRLTIECLSSEAARADPDELLAGCARMLGCVGTPAGTLVPRFKADLLCVEGTMMPEADVAARGTTT